MNSLDFSCRIRPTFYVVQPNEALFSSLGSRSADAQEAELRPLKPSTLTVIPRRMLPAGKRVVQ